MKERNFLIPETLLASLIAYLQERPYKEVSKAVSLLSSLQVAKPQDEQSE